MPALPLIFCANPQISIMTPQGSRCGYEPFWATHYWLFDNVRFRGRILLAQDYAARVLASDEAALQLRCAERGMQPAATREQTIAKLLACLDGLGDMPDRLDVATYQELVTECRLLNLPAGGGVDELRARLKAAAQPIPAPVDEVPDAPPADQPPAEDVPSAPSDEPLPEPADEVPAPVEPAEPAASLPPFDAAQLVQLKAHLEADNYNGVWSVGTNLTSSRPADKSKAAVYAWARALIQELEG